MGGRATRDQSVTARAQLLGKWGRDSRRWRGAAGVVATGRRGAEVWAWGVVEEVTADARAWTGGGGEERERMGGREERARGGEVQSGRRCSSQLKRQGAPARALDFRCGADAPAPLLPGSTASTAHRPSHVNVGAACARSW